VHRKERAAHRKQRAVHREEQAELLYECGPSRSLDGAMRHELAGERSSFVEHRSLARIASLLRRGRPRGRASEALGARSASLRVSGRTRSIRTVSLRTGSEALPLRTDAPPLPSDARRERRGAFRTAYRFSTRGQRCPDQTMGCAARR
jgi:hypothetical protein